MGKETISAVVLTKNEEKNIAKCIESLVFCSEIIVIDDNSTDKTVEIAKKLGAKMYRNSLENNFAYQRNFGLSKAASEWTFFVDADEQISQKLQEEIQEKIASTSSNGFYFKRVDTMWNRKFHHGEVGDVRLLRLGRKGKGKWIGKVHEAWAVRGKTETLRNPIIHFPHQTLSEFLSEINFYTDIRSKELYDLQVQSSFFSVLFHPGGKFLHNYFFRLGILDGMPGLVFAICMSFHSFLVRGKLWLLWQKNK